ncbi:protein-export chaperone SecB [Salinibius halmophilus]|uniref:protein-export chaperone SecB n=1 Tax=Salinibius halmophilus TaxID=1853216 RepID=UPI000E67615F|nr:protein-export chaperone SecB [Salinibius halmophilus]
MSEQQQGPQFSIQRIYLKDMSFETPNSPEIFREEWKPQLKLDLDNKTTKLDDDNWEVVLTITLTAKVGEKTAFLIEVQQAGIFLAKGFEEDQLKNMLGSYCPTTLFPYARETIDNLLVKGSFPPAMLAPINFEAMYRQAQQNQQQAAPAASEEAQH